jgi:CcmD family protein
MSNSKTEGLVQEQKPFEPITSITTEQLPATPLLYSAYGAVWVVLLLYVFVLARRLTRVERDLRDVSARITKRG